VTPITKTGATAVYDRAVSRQTAQAISGVRMDRTTKATLWIAFVVLFSYFAWFYLDCAMDESCHLVCNSGGRAGCHPERKPDLRPH
jgi:hypothetical protein